MIIIQGVQIFLVTSPDYTGAETSLTVGLCKLIVGTLSHKLLEFSNLDENMELSRILLTAATLSVIWKERKAGSRVRTYQLRSELEQTINLLRTTRLCNVSLALEAQYNMIG